MEMLDGEVDVRTEGVKYLCVGDGDLDLHTWFDGDGGDLLDDLGGRVQVDDPLVVPHLETIPGLGTLSARSLTGGDSQGLGGHPDGSLGLEFLLLGTLDKVGAHLLQALDGAAGQGDPDPVDHGLLSLALGVLVS